MIPVNVKEVLCIGEEAREKNNPATLPTTRRPQSLGRGVGGAE